MSTIRWGILGTGGIAHRQAADLIANGFTVSAVGSRHQHSADAFAVEFGIPTAHASYRELVEDPEVDVVYVATPHPYHASNTLLALNAGKHALVEKPFAMTAEQAHQMVELAAQKNLVVLEAMWTRYLPHMVRIRRLIADGVIGELRALLADHSQKLSEDPTHRINDPQLGGGALLDLGIYPVSFAYDLFGEPQTVQAVCSRTSTGVDLQTSVLLGYRSDAQALLHCTRDARGPNTATIIGTEGRIDLDSTWFSQTGFTVTSSAGDLIERFDPEPTTSRGSQYQAWEVERLITAGSTGGEMLPPQQSVAIMAVMDRIREQLGLVYPEVRSQ